MLYRLKLILFLMFPFWMFLFNKAHIITDKSIEINHKVVVNHPGEEVPVETILTEIQTKDSITVGYAMNVESVICLEEVCKIIPVRLFWNDIGVYQKYVLDEGKTLEKYEADLFEPDDYIKLHSVLANENSPFKDVLIHEVLTVVEDDSVDAVAGATALELDEKDTVPGAALTCYTLWHWAHGDIIQTIKRKTGESSTNQQLMQFLSHENQRYYPIALEALEKRGNYALNTVQTVIERTSMNIDLTKASIQYLETAPDDIYRTALKEIFRKGDRLQRIAVIRSLLYSKKDLTGYLDTYASEIGTLKSFQEVSVFLGLMEAKNLNSERINRALIPLLEREFLIARRVYWFLSEQNNLDSASHEKLKNFLKKHADRL